MMAEGFLCWDTATFNRAQRNSLCARTRPEIEWKTPRFGDAGKGVLDGVLPIAQQVELQQRAEAMAIYRANEGRGVGGVRLDPVLRAHWGLVGLK